MGYRYGDAGNLAVRVLLRQLGVQHDIRVNNLTGNALESKNLKPVLRSDWQNSCCYCDQELGEKFDIDHVVPMNQEHSGLHCMANVVPACVKCNKIKKSLTVIEFLDKMPEFEAEKIVGRIKNWEKKWGGNPSGLDQERASKLHSSVAAIIKKVVAETN